jgi:hypothetical protein
VILMTRRMRMRRLRPRLVLKWKFRTLRPSLE